MLIMIIASKQISNRENNKDISCFDVLFLEDLLFEKLVFSFNRPSQNMVINPKRKKIGIKKMATVFDNKPRPKNIPIRIKYNHDRFCV